MDSLFKEYRENPPLYKNNPPVAGAIYWEKSLFLRIKHTIIRFQTMEEMMTSEQGKAVSVHHCIVHTIGYLSTVTGSLNLLEI